MLNQVVLVGRLTKEVELKEKGEKKYSNITLAVPRCFKNAEGNYDTDFMEVKIFDSVASNTKTYCKKGDIIGVKGRIQQGVIANDSGEIIGNTNEIIGEKITFLSSKKEGEE